MITIEQATTHRGDFHHRTIRNADGTPARCRRNGQCKTWKTRPGEFSLPVKHGLRQCFYITQHNAADWCLTAEEARGKSEPLNKLRHHVTGAIERGEAEAITEQKAS